MSCGEYTLFNYKKGSPLSWTNVLTTAFIENRLRGEPFSIVMLKRCKCIYRASMDLAVLCDLARKQADVRLDSIVLRNSACPTLWHARIQPHRLQLIELDDGELVFSELL